ncbi:MAG: inositol monophosphatase [Candidatus Dadabacteria bacterium]|nr:MAG: inositol monophosphatase [Candidatus Dadabacteria bacterium]
MLTKKERENIEEIVEQVGAFLLKLWQEAKDGRLLRVKRKEDGSPVTEADEKANEILLSFLKKNFPDEPVLSEEGGDERIKQLDNLRDKYWWLVDPLDGTKNFIRGEDCFAVFLARCFESKPQYGVLYFPALKKLVWGEKGVGGFLNRKPLLLSTISSLASARIQTRSFSKAPFLENKTASLKKAVHSGDAFLKLFEGEIEGVILERKICLWDIAAPAAILHSCGGAITDKEGKELLFSHLNPFFDGILIASNGSIHKELIEELKALRL